MVEKPLNMPHRVYARTFYSCAVKSSIQATEEWIKMS